MTISNKHLTRLLQAFIVAIPLIHLKYQESFGWDSVQNDRNVQERFFVLLTMCLVSFMSGSIWITLFMIWNVFLLCYQGMTVGANQVINIFAGICLFIFSKQFFAKNDFKVLKTPIFIVCGLTIFWMVLQYFSIDPLMMAQRGDGVKFYRPFNDPVGLFHIKMANGFFILIATIFLTLLSPIFTILMAFPIYLSKSVSVYMAYFAWIIFFIYWRYRRFFILSLILGIGITAFGAWYDFKGDSKTFKSRFPMWHMTVKYALQYPLGYGPDSYRKLNNHKNFLFKSDNGYNPMVSFPQKDGSENVMFYSVRNDSEESKKKADEVVKNGLKNNELNFWDNPHNAVLNILFQYGIAGFLILIGFIREIIFRFKKSAKDMEVIVLFGCLMAYFIASLTNFPLELARTAYLFPIILGAFYYKTEGVLN